MTARETAVRILAKIEQDKSFAGLTLKNALHTLANSREKALATELVYGTIRYKKQLDSVRDAFSSIKASKLHPITVQILRIGLYQILHLEKIPPSAACNESVKLAKALVNEGAGRYVNGVLRAVLREKNSLPCPAEPLAKLGYQTSFPKTILELWVADYGFEKACEIAQNSNIPKKASYRINYLKAGSDFVLPTDLNVPKEEELFQTGILTVQDKGSQLAVETLNSKPNQKVLDMCAAPGGKSCYIAEKMQNTGEIIACDVYEHRLKLIEETAARLGATNIKLVINDGAQFRSEWESLFDCVLADVPCSGLGVISGKPDIKWRKQDYKSLCTLQKQILDNAMRYVKQGGTLVYSTCTVHKAENEDAVRACLENHKDFSIQSETQLFPDQNHDGFYVCKLKKV